MSLVVVVDIIEETLADDATSYGNKWKSVLSARASTSTPLNVNILILEP